VSQNRSCEKKTACPHCGKLGVGSRPRKHFTGHALVLIWKCRYCKKTTQERVRAGEGS
jgi:hypothetical protein